MVVDLTSSVRRNVCMNSNIPLMHCIQSTVVNVQQLPVFLKFTQRIATTQMESNQKITKTDKHAAKYSKTVCLGLN